MIVALDNDFNRIHIENAVAKQECYCPSCGARLFQRKGQLRRHHFAHMPGHVSAVGTPSALHTGM